MLGLEQHDEPTDSVTTTACTMLSFSKFCIREQCAHYMCTLCGNRHIKVASRRAWVSSLTASANNE